MLLPVIQVLMTIFVIICTTLVIYYKWSFTHWKRKGLPFIKPSFPFGNMENPFNRTLSLGFLMKKYYEEFKSRGCKHGGIYNFTSPVYILVDPEYIKNIMMNDFQYFVDRGNFYNEKYDPLSAHLFNIGGQKWKNLRAKLTPTFTSGKMKNMFDILTKCADNMTEAVDKWCKNGEVIGAKDVLSRFTTDIIGLVAFGLECNSFKNSLPEFNMHGRNMLRPQTKLKALASIFAHAKPKLAENLGIYFLPRVSTKFFANAIKETMQYREENNVVRNDVLQLLIQMKETGDNKDSGKTLTFKEIAAQAMVFFNAGFETSSTTMSFCLFELAQHQDIQDKVRNEINEVLKQSDGKLTYDTMNQMKYLGQVIDETLRKHPSVPFVTRRCVKDYKVPDTDVVIDKGTLVFIPLMGLHRDPEYFPNPEIFDPERFTEKNKENIVPFTYLPFGDGPRFCIAFRFAMMQTKVGLISLLKDYRFTLSSKTTLPLEIHKYTLFILASKNDILLNVEKVAHI